MQTIPFARCPLFTCDLQDYYKKSRNFSLFGRGGRTRVVKYCLTKLIISSRLLWREDHLWTTIHKGHGVKLFRGQPIAPHTPTWYENPLFCSSSTNFQYPAYRAQLDLTELQNLRIWKPKISEIYCIFSNLNFWKCSTLVSDSKIEM